MKVSSEHVNYVQLLLHFSEYISSNHKDIKESQGTYILSTGSQYFT